MLEHVDGIYKIYGNYEEIFTQGNSSHEFRTKGPTYIEFKDNDKYLLYWPPKILEDNIFMKYDEYIFIEHVDNGIASVVFLGDNVDQEGSAIEGIIYKQDKESEFNTQARCIDDLTNVEETIGYVEGSWLDLGIIDNKIYWDKKEHKYIPHVPVSNPLPSDSRYREDLIWLWKGTNLEHAQNWKMALEERQRIDAKLRKK